MDFLKGILVGWLLGQLISILWDMRKENKIDQDQEDY